MSKDPGSEVLTQAKYFLRTYDAGVLSTIIEHEGEDFPFGSMCPYILTLEGEVAILISDIAKHTKNIKRNSKVSFTVFNKQGKNKQAAGRISLVGKAEMVEAKSEKHQQISERYLTFFPEAKSYFEAHNFNFFTIRPKMAHYIQTFGKIYTFDGGLLLDDLPEWLGDEQGVIDHMNEDHQNVYGKYLSDANIELKGSSEDLKLIQFDQYGFHLKDKEDIYYLNYSARANTKGDLRVRFVELAKR